MKGFEARFHCTYASWKEISFIYILMAQELRDNIFTLHNKAKHRNYLMENVTMKLQLQIFAIESNFYSICI